MRQMVPSRPSTTYAVSFLFRYLKSNANVSNIAIYYAGVRVGSASCPAGNSGAVNRATGIQFTTNLTGGGKLEIRFNNPSSQQYLYYYADDFQAVAV
ncbi:hypothetical protein B0T18DRAFT_403469 [Schizothecium vesticola]|uniref:Uncharacterized protein n=1 Tax=Schizothecium vesticola TaxID=314040 RepID=A0AA40F5Z6_9PEZI|nr:hypothetical protein B0T18DRAFT_403469 [Schizothecium vesticola]